MMATKAQHKTGDLSRNAESLCVVWEEDEESYIGKWLTGFGFFDVHFPKKSTRELTAEEAARWNGETFGIPGGIVLHHVIIPGAGVSPKAMVVKTANSAYRVGAADENGMRSISRDGRPINFSTTKIICLKKGMQMITTVEDHDPETETWETTNVVSIEMDEVPAPFIA